MSGKTYMKLAMMKIRQDITKKDKLQTTDYLINKSDLSFPPQITITKTSPLRFQAEKLSSYGVFSPFSHKN